MGINNSDGSIENLKEALDSVTELVTILGSSGALNQSTALIASLESVLASADGLRKALETATSAGGGRQKDQRTLLDIF